MPVIRVISYNIHKGRSAMGGRDSLYDLRLGLYGLRPDLLFLQEVQGRNERSRLLHAQHESLAAGLHLQAAYGCNAVRRRSDHGNALLSRFNILEFENQDISDHPLEQRGMLHARVDIYGHEVHCFVLHLGLWGGSRIRQVSALVERIDRLVPPGALLLIAGDFNDWKDQLAPLFMNKLGVGEVFAQAPRSMGYDQDVRRRGDVPVSVRDSMRHLASVLRGRVQHMRSNRLGMQGATLSLPPPRTFPAAFPWLRLDRIYQRGFAVRSARVLRGSPWTRSSDHAPLLAELELP